MDNNNKPITLQKEMVQRLIKDVKQIKKNPLTDHNIYYHHDEENILKGYALIVGPENTPYFGGYYLFELNYPIDYPHSPPILNFVTNGENIRFNPNLYVTGKVCISLLNTWRGEQWTSCQTISTVLLTLGTLFINEPLLNEPGITKTHNDFYKYSNIIKYKNIDIAIINVIQQKPKSYYSKYSFIQHFDSIIREKFLENKDKIISFLEKNKNNNIELVKTNIYNMSVTIDYERLYEKFISLTNEI